jgi:hypothetical protein
MKLLINNTLNLFAMEASITSQNDTQDALKRTPRCWKCKSTLDRRVPRSTLVKVFLFWLPLRRYFCYGCMKKRYVRE